MAHKKAGGSRGTAAIRNRNVSASRASAARRRRGQHHRPPARHPYHPGANVGMGRDHTLYRAVRWPGRVRGQGTEVTADRQRVSAD